MDRPGSAVGLHRVLAPTGVLPQAAERLDDRPELWPDEVRIDVERLNLDAASFRQLRAEHGDGIRDAVRCLVAARGKLQNPVTGSGGMLIGTVAEVGPASPHGLTVGDRVATLVSLTLTPLRITDGLTRWDGRTEQVPAAGHAILFGRSIAALLPADLPPALALAVLDVCGAPALTTRVVRQYAERNGRSPTVAVLGGGGKSGSLSLAAARRTGAGRTAGIVRTPVEAARLTAAGLADVVAVADARDPVALSAAVTGALGRPADLVVVCVDVPGCEGGAVLSTAPGGTVVFFSMATSFAAAALGAEGLAADVTMLIGNGYVPGHAELALDLVRSEPGVRWLLAGRVRHETPAVGGAQGRSPRRETVHMTDSTLFRGGQVYTPADPFATALLVDDGRVAWVGSDDASASFAADTVVDLDGALVTPAFVDAHVHTSATGLALTGPDLADARTLTEALDAVARFAATLPGDAVVLGHGWDETHWPEHRPPTAAELDRATGGRAGYLSRADVHSAVVSPSLLTGLDALPGFDPAGHVRIDAHHAVRAVALGTVTAAQRTDAQRAARARAASLGIAALHECGGPDIAGEADFTGLLALAAAEPGPLVFGYWGELRAAGKARELGAAGAGGDLFVDGALGSHTAHLTSPYADGDSRGHAYLDVDEIAQHLVDCARLQVQAGFHAIGDAAIAAVLAGFAGAAREVGADVLRAGRHRLEHAELLDPAMIALMAQYGVVASVQPGFDAAWGGTDGMYAERLGAERAAALNPFAALAGAGVPIAFGSDAPVTPLGPWEAVRAAVYHRTPGHRMAARAAFTAHTRGGWRAGHDDEAGTLVPGAPAHLAVWAAGDLVIATADDRVARWSTDPAAGVLGLPDVAPGTPLPTCLRTVVGGTTVYARE